MCILRLRVSAHDCENGTYGVNCSSRCGHCLGGTPCNATDGACPGECQGTWKGPRCDQRKGNPFVLLIQQSGK